MPKLRYIDEEMDNLLPTMETVQRYARTAGLDREYATAKLISDFIRPHEGTMAEYFLECQDPWDDDWGN